MTRGRYGIFRGVAAVLSRPAERLAAALLVAGIFAGCAAERAVLTTDAGPTYEALREGGLAIVGVTVIEEVEQVRPPLNAMLEAVPRETHPDLRVRNADAMRDTLGLAEYRRLLTAYQSAGKLTDADRGVLVARLRRSARFALLARVDKDVVRLPPTRAPLSRSASAANARFGAPTVSRDARLRVTLSDLETNREAWAAVYASSTDNIVPDSTSRPPDVRLTPPLGSPAEPPMDPLPETPSLALALVEGFRAFAADLPAKPGAPASTALPRR